MLHQENAPMTTEGTQVRDVLVNQVYRTTNYERFSILYGNRKVNLLHLNRLQKSISESDLTESNPILVNEKFEIIDGQHRFEACKKLNKPIHYILKMGFGLKEVQRLNANGKNWKMEDSINSYCELGMDEYLYFKSFLAQYKLGIVNSLQILSTWDSAKLEEVVNGHMKLNNKARGETLGKWIEEIKPIYKGYSRRSFISAMMRLYANRQFNFKQLMAKLQYQQTKLVDCTDTKGYLTLLEEIYNYKERSERLRFF